jgi:pimeloyl-ACP methyl ester carboxylesterase
VLALTAGCATDDTADPATTPPTTGATAGSNSVTTDGDDAAPDLDFTGELEAFYSVPEPLPSGEPGDLIRVQALESPDEGTTSVRVMYHSRDAQDRDRAVTGVITWPNAAPPEGGWPVVAWAHGTTGLTSVCAPSRLGGEAPRFGIEGVGVATDYIGLGPIGERHPYLSGLSEGRSVIDAVRAARNLTDAHAGERWVAVGHSQGGHAALFTNELGEAYASELDLLGTTVIAPAAVLDTLFGPEDQIVPRMVGVMALYGLAADYPEVDPDDYASDALEEVAPIIDEACTQRVVEELLTVGLEGFYDVDPLTTEPARTVWLANDPGNVRVDAPVLLVLGTKDTWVVPARVMALYDRLCGIDQVVELAEVDGADHGTVVGMAGETITAWFEDRFAGDPAESTCDS